MSPLDLQLLLLVALFFAGGWLALWRWTRGRGTRQPAPARSRKRRGLIESPCGVCRRPMVFTRDEMQKLSPAEIALVVRRRPDLIGKTFAEYTCPYCESAHTYVVQHKDLEWLGANLDRPQVNTSNCQECGQTLGTPPWSAGEYDGRVTEAPYRQDLGLKCSRCGATCCVGCTQNFSQHRAANGELWCPRCGRPPMNIFWHPYGAGS